VNIIQAMSDPSLFGKVLRRSFWHKDSWRSWRCFLSSLFGLGLIEPGDLEVYQKHTGRIDVQAEPYREAYCVVGRRGGKSLIGAAVACYLAAFVDYSRVLAPGEVGVVMFLAGDRRQARVCMNYCRAFFEIPLLRRLVRRELKESIELVNNIRVEIHTSDYKSVRGYTVVAAVLDEISFWPHDDSASPDSEVVSALRPAMSTIPSALLLGLSSPYSKRGVLWESYRQHFGKAGAPVLIWQSDSLSMNPTISRRTIENAYLQDPVSAAAEYGGLFRDDISGFLSLELVERCTVAERRELLPVPGVDYRGFVDSSGGVSDSAVLAISHCEGQRAVLDAVREREAPFSPQSATQEFSAMLKRFGLSSVVGDRYSGQWIAQEFARYGIQYVPSERNRSQIYLEALPLFSAQRCELLDLPRLKNQLVNLERRTARGGQDSVDHGVGQHDDVSNAVCGALVLAAGEGDVFGLIQLLQRISRGEFDTEAKMVFPPPVTRAPVVPVLPPTACPKCGSAKFVIVAGAALHCNRCQHSFFKDGQSPEVVTAGFKFGRPSVYLRRLQ
jgi:hypothetical protein